MTLFNPPAPRSRAGGPARLAVLALALLGLLAAPALQAQSSPAKPAPAKPSSNAKAKGSSPAKATKKAGSTKTKKTSGKKVPANKPTGQASSRGTPAHVVGAKAYGTRDDVRAFAQELASQRGLDADWALQQLAQARRIDSVQKLMMPPTTEAGTPAPKDWGAYRDRFVEPRRITAGAAFWQVNAEALGRAEARFGVPVEVIVGVAGVETFYGRLNGAFRVIDALATLAFDFPEGRSDRSAFFRSELAEFLVLCRREGLDPQTAKGSFAGAMGMAQFMPGSINRYAVDFDGDGRVDLTGSSADAIGSIANYLAQHGWQRGQPATYAVHAPADEAQRNRLLQPDIQPSFSAAQFAEAGAELEPSGRDHTGPLALVQLENGHRPASYVAGTQNFYVLTRYNWSSLYAMAVLELGAAVKQLR
jgi:membrane-bound lytic murein transglycosylase B